MKLPPKPGIATAGLKLPPKPGLATAGLKLPPKPGFATAGLKLPPKPGLPTQTGLKLPPRPTIHKPGSTLSTARPTLPGLKKPTLPGVKPAPAAAAPAPAPVTELTPLTQAELKPEAPLEALKSATQNLKSVTAPIPQQAILRKTGMLAEGQTDVQKQAAKSKTSRISLSEAMGAAPVKNEAAPMKTIRIKRPIDIPGVNGTAAGAATPGGQPKAETPASEAATKPAEAAPAADPAVTMTQRKTLKISRPAGGVVRPSGKFGIKRPGTMMTQKAAKPAASSAGAADDGKPKDDVADIADIPSLPTAPVPKALPVESDLPKGVAILGILIQAAACVVMGALAWWLYSDTQILPF